MLQPTAAPQEHPATLHKILPFPAVPTNTTQPPLVIRPATLATHANKSRLHLYQPTEEELAHRALDRAAQIGLFVERLDDEIERAITRDRINRLYSRF